jgi:hypothetical protein
VQKARLTLSLLEHLKRREISMKRLLFLIVALTLASCTAAPTQAPTAQPVAPEPVVVTVVVQPTQVPPQQEPVVVTVVVQASPVPVQATAIPATLAPAATTASGDAPLVIPDVLGKGVFTNITLTGDTFTLQCLPREITLTATAALPDIREAELFYRMVDQPKALYYSDWRSAGRLHAEGNGVFSMVLTGETVHPDLRLDPGWFEFQLVGLNSGGGVIDRTQKIEQTVTYRIRCP